MIDWFLGVSMVLLVAASAWLGLAGIFAFARRKWDSAIFTTLWSFAAFVFAMIAVGVRAYFFNPHLDGSHIGPEMKPAIVAASAVELLVTALFGVPLGVVAALLQRFWPRAR